MRLFFVSLSLVPFITGCYLDRMEDHIVATKEGVEKTEVKLDDLGRGERVGLALTVVTNKLVSKHQRVSSAEVVVLESDDGRFPKYLRASANHFKSASHKRTVSVILDDGTKDQVTLDFPNVTLIERGRSKDLGINGMDEELFEVYNDSLNGEEGLIKQGTDILMAPDADPETIKKFKTKTMRAIHAATI